MKKGESEMNTFYEEPFDLFKWINKNNLEHGEAAEILGVSKNTISFWIHGKRKYNVKMLEMACGYYDLMQMKFQQTEETSNKKNGKIHVKY